MKIKIEFTIENSMDAAQIDENLKRAIAAGVTETTVAGQIRDEFKRMLMSQTWGNDINDKPVVADIVGVEVFADSNETSVFSEWHKED
jgi:isochorismate hydrolase